MLEVKQLSKSFEGNYVLKNVSLSIEAGEIYGLIGANGSGKSTLMNILNGNEKIRRTGGYEGEILIDGKEIRIENRAQSEAQGIAMVHQELALFAGMTVGENIKINRENVKGRGLFVPELAYVDQKKNREDAARTLERIGTDLDPDSPIDSLALNQKQFVEIARELDNQNVRLLMLDEPTSSLNITETKGLLACIREIAREGIAVLFISHRLDEIMEVCDRVSVLRDGELISTYKKEEFDAARFADDMVGREIVKAARHETQSGGQVLFSYEGLPDNQTLDILEGEILGITGLAGQGQENLLDGLFGMKKAEYQAVYRGKKLKPGDTENLIHHRIYYLSEDRGTASLLLDSPIWENMVFGTEKVHPEFLRFRNCPALSFLNHKAIDSHARELIDRLNIVCRGPEQKVRELSGGNQQKVCVSRAITFQPELLLIGEPTRGIDVYSKELILKWLLKINKEYRTTLVVASGELEELLRICDRIAVMHQGKVFKIFDNNSTSLEELTLALYGRELR